MNTSPLSRLPALGQSPWLDLIQRSLLEGGGLQRMIDEWGLRGVTSNPAIFEQSITGTPDYDAAIAQQARAGAGAEQIYETLALADIAAAADLFLPVYQSTHCEDGFVSIEVSPRLARDAYGTIAEARRLWAALRRPNVMIKVPGTEAGLVAMRTLLAEGININVTLLFSVARYREVASAYLGGLEAAIAAGRPIARIASVASFFLSRIDTAVDRELEGLVAAGGARADAAAQLLGEAAVASARAAYGVLTELLATQRFRELATRGARVQRLLWASTGTKNPRYSDIKYVEPLIGPHTVNTLPLKTLEAYHDHGRPALRLTGSDAGGEDVVQRLAALGIDLDRVTGQLLEEGIAQFVAPHERLLAAIEERRRASLAEGA